MPSSPDYKESINHFCESTVIATGLLYEKNLYGQMLVLVYSAIDTMGLLIAEPEQTKSTGNTFKNWVDNYLLTNPEFEFNAIDVWAARCSVLHTFSSESDLSKAGNAREIQYFSGPKDHPMAVAFVAATLDMDNGKHVPAHIEDTYTAFLSGLEKFSKDLLSNCESNVAYKTRLAKVLQKHLL